MKKKTLILLTCSLFTLTVAGCEPAPTPEVSEPVFSNGKLIEKKFQSFNFSRAHLFAGDELEKVSNYDIGERTFYYLENYQYDYYLTLNDYFDIIKTNAKEGYKFSITNENYVYTIEVADPQNKRISYTTIDIENRVIDYQGSMSSAFNEAAEIDYDTYSLYLDVKYEDSHTIPYDQRVKKDSFKYIDYQFFKKDGKAYFPLSLLTAHYNKEFGINYIFDDKLMYFYDEESQIKSLFFLEKPIGGMVEDNIHDWISNTFKSTGSTEEYLMPVEMARANRNAFYYAMDNYYGIRTTRSIESYAKLFENYSWSEKFLSPKGADRGYAYATAVNMLDDEHTALGLSAIGLSIWEEKSGFSDAVPSKLKDERSALNNALNNQRLKAFGLENSKQLRTFDKYSEDGKTAYIYLNEFAYTADAAKKEGGQIVSRKTEEELAKDESYYYLLNRIKKLQDGVENIVIDMSTNGGGTIGVLYKIASLFAKSNGFETFTMNDMTGDISGTKTYIDSNYDGKYDDTDVFGNKYKFYLLTSPCSFSCGNALPFYCGLAKTATVIGQRSGGGECSVTTSQIGSLRRFQHSSNTHITTFKTEIVGGQEKKTQMFAEGGADVETGYEFGYEHFYDFQYIANLIKENQSN